MTLVRLSNGGDVLVQLSVEETISAIAIASGGPEFVELPGEEGPVHVRPASVIAVLEDASRRHAGFRALADIARGE